MACNTQQTYPVALLQQMSRSLCSIVILPLLLTGCFLPKAQRGGSATVTGSQAAVAPAAPTATVSTLGMPSATISQPENPQGSSGQAVSYEHVKTEETPVDVIVKTVTEYPDGRKVTVEKPVPAGTVTVESVKQSVEQSLGGSWKDTARELAAKLGAYSKLQYIGVGLILFAAAGLFYAPLRIILGGGKQFPIAVGALGSILTVLPMLIVGNEAVALIAAIVVGGVAWLIIRTTRKEAEADMLKNNGS